MIRKHFRIRRIVIGFAFAAFLAPSAQAYTGYTLDGGTPGVYRTDARHQALLDRHFAAGQLQLPIASTERKIASEISVQSTPTSLDAETMRWQAMKDYYARQIPLRSENSFGAPGPSAAGAQGPVATRTVTQVASNSFDWSDAGIGGSIVFGAALMLLAAVLLGRRHNRSLASV
jgi:hypothetical protein